MSFLCRSSVLLASMAFLTPIASFQMLQPPSRSQLQLPLPLQPRDHRPIFRKNLNHFQSLKASIDKSEESTKSSKRKDGLDLDLPWGERQEWALRDNIQKYILEIPQLKNNSDGNTFNRYAMWKALMRDTIELAGYDVSFLRQKYETDAELKGEAPGALPLLDGFEFKSNGGVSGQIQGLCGIADGTTVQTSPLVHVQLTVPRGYVLTEDGSSAYELGSPLSEDFYNLDIAGMGRNLKVELDVNGVAQSLKSGVEETTRVAGNLASVVGDKETTSMLVNLGATTGIVLGGALAVNLLSHHLTLNVFWV